MTNIKKSMVWDKCEYGWHGKYTNIEFKIRKYISMDSRGGIYGIGHIDL